MSLCWRAHCSSRWRSAHTPRPDPPRPYSDRPRFPCWGSCSSLADSTRERAFGRSGHAELPCPSAQIAFQTRTRSGTRAHSSTTLILKQHHHFAYDRASRKYDETVAAVQRQNGTATSCKSRLCGAVPYSRRGSIFCAGPSRRKTKPLWGSSACGRQADPPVTETLQPEAIKRMNQMNFVQTKRSRPKPAAVPARRDQRHRVQGRALVRRCAPPSKMRTVFEK
jgi:hypothetical protein